MGLKENFYQALRELLGRKEPEVSNSKEKVNTDFELELKRASSVQDLPTPKRNYSSIDKEDNSSESSESDKNFRDEREPEVKSTSETNGIFNRPNLFSRPVQPNRQYGTVNERSSDWADYFNQPSDSQIRADEEMTVISKSTVIDGNIRSLANVTIEGKVRGEVNVLKNAMIRGVLVGDLMCTNSNMNSSSVQGNILAKGNAFIDNDSILLGDMKAQNTSIDGKVKGNMDIGSKIHLHQNAIVAGNINTDKIKVEEGANIKGFINTTFLFENEESAFPNEVESGD